MRIFLEIGHWKNLILLLEDANSLFEFLNILFIIRQDKI